MRKKICTQLSVNINTHSFPQFEKNILFKDIYHLVLVVNTVYLMNILRILYKLQKNQ